MLNLESACEIFQITSYITTQCQTPIFCTPLSSTK